MLEAGVIVDDHPVNPVKLKTTAAAELIGQAVQRLQAGADIHEASFKEIIAEELKPHFKATLVNAARQARDNHTPFSV